MDWNWFFSSFSQSAAALIGIIGAFIISRLLGLNEKISATISHFDQLLIDFNHLKASISIRHFSWYTNLSVFYDSDLKDSIENGEFENLNQVEILNKIYQNNSNLFKIDDSVLEAFNKLYEEYRPRHIPVQEGFSIIQRKLLSKIAPVGLWDSLNAEREAINQLEVESHTLIQHFQQNLQDLNSFISTIKPLRIIIIILMISFPLTVIYSLHFMPVPNNEELAITFNPIVIIQSIFTIKFLLLFILFCTVEGILCYFLIQTYQLDHKLVLAIQTNSDDLRNMKNYSEYFKEK
jgi:hypothetical protein